MKYHHGDLKNALIEAALSYLDQQGEIPSLRALAEDCGVSHGAPYRHFEGALDLQGSIAAACFRDLAEATRNRGTDASPRDTLIRGCRAYVEWGLHHPARYALMFGTRSPISHHRECQEASVAAFQTLVDAIAACGAEDPMRMALAAWAALHGAVELGRHGLAPPGTTPDRLTDDVVEMIVARAVAAS